MALTATSTAPAQLVAGPGRLPVNYGLLSVVSMESPADPHWQMPGGVTWEALESYDLGVIEKLAVDTDAETGTNSFTAEGLPKSFDAGGLTPRTAAQFTLYATAKCSPIGNDEAYFQDLAQTRLTAFEERAMEQMLWAQLQADSEGTDDTALTLLDALADAEQHLADNYGSLGVLHLNRATFTRLAAEAKLETRGGRAFSMLGTPIIAGQGYGSGLVATGALRGIWSEVFTSTTTQANALDRAQNNLYGLAERSYLFMADAPIHRISITS